ncbi:MAG: porphobilinogen synthase [Vampirovibrionales bacterium]|nr:porphobilinogen synthase [Vampirovibrionales bacterium]
MFPSVRLRRLRQTPLLRDMCAETVLDVSRLVWPVFVSDQPGDPRPIASMPGVFQYSVDSLLQEAEQNLGLGLKSVIVFGVCDEKDGQGTLAYSDEGPSQLAIKALKANFGDNLLVIADTCLCAYTHHGHCGIVMDGKILNDPTLELLGRIAVSQAHAGADIIAPSDMMDGRVAWIRNSLDEDGFQDTLILSYAAKFASALYGPFREAAASSPLFGDRKTYQMDARNRRQAIEEVTLDVGEGADMILVKPALGYQDIIRDVRDIYAGTLVAYNVSGEYAMVKAAAQAGWLDERAVVLELLTGLRRAGADWVISYHAPDVARWLAA